MSEVFEEALQVTSIIENIKPVTEDLVSITKPVLKASPSSDSQQPGFTGLRMEGWLEKKSDYVGRFNWRYCRLGEDAVLSWYDDISADTIARAKVSLVGAEISTQDLQADVQDGTAPEATTFVTIKAPLRGAAPMTFRCPDAERRDAWAVTLKEIAEAATAERAKVLEAARLAELNAAEEKRRRAEERKIAEVNAAAEKRRLAEERKNNRTSRPSSPSGATRSPSGSTSRGAMSTDASTENTVDQPFLAAEIAKLVNPEITVLGTALHEHDERTNDVIAKGEAAAAEMNRIRAQQMGGMGLKDQRIAEIDAASAALRKHADALSLLAAEEAAARSAIDGAEGNSRSKAVRLGAEEERRRATIRGLDEERKALLEAQQSERGALGERISTASEEEAAAASHVNVTTTRCEMRAERKRALQGRLEALIHERAVAGAALDGLRFELDAAAKRKAKVEAALQDTSEAAASVCSDIAKVEQVGRTAKLLAHSNEERLKAALASASKYACVVTKYAKGRPKDPTYKSATAEVAEGEDAAEETKERAEEHAERVVSSIQAQLEAARAREEVRARTATDELRALRARATATEVTMVKKRAHLVELTTAWELLVEEVARAERAIAAAEELEGALAAELLELNEEIAKLKATLAAELVANDAALAHVAQLRAEDKALAVQHEQVLAAVDAHLAEDKAHCDALAVKLAPIALAAVGSVVVIESSTSEGSSSEFHSSPSDLPSLFHSAIEKTKQYLLRLADMRAAVLQDHSADAKQLAARATIASATVAASAAQQAAHMRARAALSRFEAAMAAA